MKRILKLLSVAVLSIGIITGIAESATVLFPYQGGTGTGTAPTSGQIMIGTTGGVYSPTTVSSGTGISITPGSGSLTITNSAPFIDVASDGNTYGRKNGAWSAIASGAGDVVGPAGATDGNVALFNGATGKIIKDGGTLGTGAFATIANYVPFIGANTSLDLNAQSLKNFFVSKTADATAKFTFDVGGLSTATTRTLTIPDRSFTLDNITTSTTSNGTGFLKANGSVVSFDNSTYLTSIPLTSTYVGYGSAGNVLTGSNTLTYSGTALTTPALSVSGTAGAGYTDYVGQSSNPSAPSAGTARLFASTMNGFTRISKENEAATPVVLGRDNVFIAKNTTGGNFVKGQVVYVSGSTGAVPNIGLAKADSMTTLPAVGICLDNINANSFGQVMKLGILNQYNTNAFNTRDQIYVSTTTAGALQNTRPSGTSGSFVQRVGSILNKGIGDGSVLVTIAPFVGNLETGTTAATWTGNAIAGTTINASTGFQLGGSATSGTILIGNGINFVASTPTYPNSATSGKILVGDGTNIVLSTPTFPNASATSGKIIKSDGTNWLASTETYAAPGTSGNILTSDGTNWTSVAPSTSSAPFQTTITTRDYTENYASGILGTYATSDSSSNTIYTISANNDSTGNWARLQRIAIDSNTKLPYITHEANATSISSGSPAKIAVLGNYVYFVASFGGTYKVYRYNRSDLTNETLMTGGTFASNLSNIFSDGTYLYMFDGAYNQYRRQTVSGTTLTAGSLTASYGNPNNPWSDGTYVYRFDGSNIYKYNIAGTLQSTTSLIIKQSIGVSVGNYSLAYISSSQIYAIASSKMNMTNAGGTSGQYLLSITLNPITKP